MGLGLGWNREIHMQDRTTAKRLVLLEDDSDLRMDLEIILQEEGYEVFATADGWAALAAIEEKAPDLVLVDLMMPVMDGYSFMAELYRRGLREQFPVLLVSAAGRARDAAAWVMADDFMEKPFDLDALLARVAKLTDGPRRVSQSSKR